MIAYPEDQFHDANITHFLNHNYAVLVFIVLKDYPLSCR